MDVLTVIKKCGLVDMVVYPRHSVVVRACAGCTRGGRRWRSTLGARPPRLRGGRLAGYLHLALGR